MNAATAGRWTRWGLLVTALATGAALLASSWGSHVSAQRARVEIARGEGDLLVHSVRRYLSQRTTWPQSDELAQFLARQDPVTITYVAIAREVDQEVTDAGAVLEPPLELAAFTPGSHVMEQGGRSVLVSVPPPRGRPGGPRRGPERRSPRRLEDPPPHRSQHDFRPRRGRRGERDGRRGGRRPRPLDDSVVVVAYEPRVANQLAARSARTLTSSGLAAAGLMLTSLVFWRLSSRREAAQSELARQRRLSELGEMSAVLAHEIRNPLASLKGHAQLLAERLPSDGADRPKAERIVAEAQRLERLGSVLLDFVRSGSIERRDTDPAALVRDAVAGLGSDRIDVQANGAPATFPLDPLRMRQVLTNVLENALQASADEPCEVTLSGSRSRLVFMIRDRGPGFPAADAGEFFEPFCTTRTTGTGLGLTIARRIVEMHGGTIEAKNHPAGGAIVRFAIPRE